MSNNNDVPLQGGLDNDMLRKAWGEKLPGVEPSDRDLTAFAIGVEVGFAHARKLEKEDWSRVHHALSDAGVHPGRTDEHLADVIARALATQRAAEPVSPDRESRAALHAIADKLRAEACKVFHRCDDAADVIEWYTGQIWSLAAAPEAPGTQDGEALAEAMRLAQEFGDAMLMRGILSSTTDAKGYAKSFDEAHARKGALSAFLAPRLRPVAPEAPKAQHVATLQFWSDAPPEVEWEIEPEKLLMQFGNHRVDLFTGAAPEAHAQPEATEGAQGEHMEELSEAEIGAALYRGNTVSFMYDKARAYGDALTDTWDVLKEFGHHCDGQTRLKDKVREVLAAPQARKRVTEAEILAIVKAAPALETAEAEWLHVVRAILAHVGVELEGGGA